ncbi:hypothetical protein METBISCDRAFT_30353 [Metschnikowia bicuspidata]|uniref:FAD dependent oxidoreductase domain-containing protein n=1 Tax=Metschnikowia bicuspidata TaxID=27322 RepID=A0A4P9ZEN5_9ASCO|nr:hypothetical protein METBISCDRAFT_30353 [Metschnikowia bicuspidata]
MTTIVVLGAGDYEITVAAANLPGDLSIEYTSPFAGANSIQKIDEIGYHESKKLADNPRSDVWLRKNITYETPKAWDGAHRDHDDFVNLYDSIANGRALGKEKLIPGTAYGTVFDGMVISVPIYLSYLNQKCLEYSIVIRRVAPIKNIEDARDLHITGKKACILVNCAGLGAQRLKGLYDSKRNYVVKRQMAFVANLIEHIICVDGFNHPNEMLYAFPSKEGGTLSGGCFLVDQWSSKEDNEITKRILEHAVRFIPQLTDSTAGNPDKLHVVKVSIGLRPFSEGVPRIERDSE